MEETVKVWELAGFGLEHLLLAKRAVPEPGDSEVLVRVDAVSVNARDKLLVDGVYNSDLRFPMVQGSDAVGQVLKVGKNVTRVQPGDRVLTKLCDSLA